MSRGKEVPQSVPLNLPTATVLFEELLLLVVGQVHLVEAAFDDSSVEGGGFDCAFKQQGEQLTGNCSGGTASVTGEVMGRNVSWRLQGAANSNALTFTGTLDEAGTGIKGHFTIAGKGGQFSAVKQKQ